MLAESVRSSANNWDQNLVAKYVEKKPFGFIPESQGIIMVTFKNYLDAGMLTLLSKNSNLP